MSFSRKNIQHNLALTQRVTMFSSSIRLLNTEWGKLVIFAALSKSSNFYVVVAKSIRNLPELLWVFLIKH